MVRSHKTSGSDFGA